MGCERRNDEFFEEARVYCVELLDILRNPAKDRSSNILPQMLQFLRTSTSDTLQPFLDYLLFPLLLLLDASIDCRSSSKNESSHGLLGHNVSIKKMICDITAEGVLECLEELLKKCNLVSLDQMVLLLKKLSYGAILTQLEASEEFREGIVQCFGAILTNLYPCCSCSCPCHKGVGSHGVQLPVDSKISPAKTSPNGRTIDICLLAFLQSEDASAAVGHWLSLLLKTAETEAAMGQKGSSKLRIEAFVTFRLLTVKVGTADALAFFLPGVACHLAKVLRASKTIMSGAASSSEATYHAIKGLAEFLMVVLADDANLAAFDDAASSYLHPNHVGSAESILEQLGRLTDSKPYTEEAAVQILGINSTCNGATKISLKEESFPQNSVRSFRVNRSRNWIHETSRNVDKILQATFPEICIHPSKMVRSGLLDAIKGLLTTCSFTLKDSRLMLMECLCVLVCDRSDELSISAQKFLEELSTGNKHQFKQEFVELIHRVIERLPKVFLQSDEQLAQSYAKKLLALLYYSGPHLVVDHLLRSPVAAAQFLDVLLVCLGHNSTFYGSLDKLLLDKAYSAAYFPRITEMTIDLCVEYDLLRLPPWLSSRGSQRSYEVLVDVLRLVGLSLIEDVDGNGFPNITDVPLQYLRQLVSELQKRESSLEDWQSWYNRIGSGLVLRQASVAAYILNELVFGMSNQAADMFQKMFRRPIAEKSSVRNALSFGGSHSLSNEPIPLGWQNHAVYQVLGYIGNILHEYLSPELWDLPMENKSTCLQSNCAAENVTLYFLQEVANLQQVLIEGIGIFNICLGKHFDSSGFLHSSLYLLLENLSSSSSQVRHAACSVLRLLCVTSGYESVGYFVSGNADYLVDAISRQLHHLDQNSRIPNLLAGILSYVGEAQRILPLLEEPMRSVSLELEILGRQQHPTFTVPFLKAVAEITKASKREASMMPSEVMSLSRHAMSELSSWENTAKNSATELCDEFSLNSSSSNSGRTCSMETGMGGDKLEETLVELAKFKRYRRSVGSITGSCLACATPILASGQQTACLVALDIIEDGMKSLSQIEEAYRQERETVEAIEESVCSSRYHLKDLLDVGGDGADENRLLPAMNKIWPFLIVCVRHIDPVVVRRCLGAVSNVVEVCGGDFFLRRFYTDGSNFWKLLSSSPFKRKPLLKEERNRMLLPYRNTSFSSPENSAAETSNQKVQVAALDMIASISRNKRSAPALDAVLKKVSGLVVGIACSGILGLREAAENALVGLASMDADLIWILVADVYYCVIKNGIVSPPTAGLPEIRQLLPAPPSRDAYLYVQYGGQTFGFDVDSSSVELVFNKLHNH